MPRRSKKKQFIQTTTDEQNVENLKPIYFTNNYKQEQALKINQIKINFLKNNIISF
jgi:hypothetical protein